MQLEYQYVFRTDHKVRLAKNRLHSLISYPCHKIMGTLEQQTRAYEAALVTFENLKADKDKDGPYKLSATDNRNLQALVNQASYGAFRLAPQESKASLGTREKQAWEALGNIPKTEAMRRVVDKIEGLKRDALCKGVQLV